MTLNPELRWYKGGDRSVIMVLNWPLTGERTFQTFYSLHGISWRRVSGWDWIKRKNADNRYCACDYTRKQSSWLNFHFTSHVPTVWLVPTHKSPVGAGFRAHRPLTPLLSPCRPPTMPAWQSQSCLSTWLDPYTVVYAGTRQYGTRSVESYTVL